MGVIKNLDVILATFMERKMGTIVDDAAVQVIFFQVTELATMTLTHLFD